MTERPPTNRLIEDKSFYDRILNKILDELENLSRTFDDQMEEMGHGRTWAEKINKIKTGEKLGSEPEVRKMILDTAQIAGLSRTELDYLLNLLFKPSKFGKQKVDDD